MNRSRFLNAAYTVTAFSAMVLAGMFLSAPHGRADTDDSESKIQRGLAIAPVRLNLAGKNRALVGLGSYIINAQGGCNDCHTDPSYKPGHSPATVTPGQDVEFNGLNYLAG